MAEGAGIICAAAAALIAAIANLCHGCWDVAKLVRKARRMGR